ncbi:hypothetical protein ACPA9J_27475 [Pseudomonas aeruginosa]
MSRPFLRRLGHRVCRFRRPVGHWWRTGRGGPAHRLQKSSDSADPDPQPGHLRARVGQAGHPGVLARGSPSGLPLLESLNVGNVDLSADVADTVPVFAQAAGARLTYFARETPSPAGAGDTGRRTFAAEVPGRAEGQAHRRDQGRRQPLPADRRAGQRRA